MSLTLVFLPLAVLVTAVADDEADHAALGAAQVALPARPWHLEFELPIAIATRRSSSGARAEVAGMGGGRAGLALDLGVWCAGAELGLLLGLPAREGSDALAVSAQDSMLEASLRFGRAYLARGFALHPYVRAAGLVGLHLALLDVAGQTDLVARPVWGGATAVGLTAGRGDWRLRWDLGWQLTTRSSQVVATVGLGVRW